MSGQDAADDYLRAAASFMDMDVPELAALCARAAHAEVEDQQTVVGEECYCSMCVEYMTMVSRMNRAVGWL